MLASALTPLEQAPRGKFVLLRGGEEIHFVCASLQSHPFHASIVFTYLQEQGRGRAEMVEKGFCFVHSQEWRVLGGGYYEADFEARLLRLHGKSTAYGKYPPASIADGIPTLASALGIPDFQVALE